MIAVSIYQEPPQDFGGLVEYSNNGSAALEIIGLYLKNQKEEIQKNAKKLADYIDENGFDFLKIFKYAKIFTGAE